MKTVAGIVFRLVVLAAVVAGGGWLVWRTRPPFEPGVHTAATAVVKGGPGPRIGNCEVLPPDNVWNTRIDGLPKDPGSDAYIENIGVVQKLHADFGTSFTSGIPFGEVPPGTPTVNITFGYQGVSDNGAYPMPLDPPLEGGPEGLGDRHIILIDPATCIDYEMFDMEQPHGYWEGGSGIKWDLRMNKLRPEDWGSADAAGLPIFPGLVRYDEVASGEIRHALRFTIPHTQNKYVWPGRHKASNINNPAVAPMGERFRLRADFNLAGFSKSNQVILRALMRYGMFLADNGGPMFLSGVPDKRWDDEDLRELNRVHAEDFEAVDESLWASKDSTRVDPRLVR